MAATADALGYSVPLRHRSVVLPVSSAPLDLSVCRAVSFQVAQQDYLEPLTVLSHLATATGDPARHERPSSSRIAIPSDRECCTIDVLSRGRVILGVGVGWLAEEFEALQAPPFEARDPSPRVPGAHAKSVDDRSRQLRRPALQ